MTASAGRRKAPGETVPAASLVEDFDLYPRHDVDSSHVADLARALRAGVELPPVVADRVSKRLVDGWHRRRAAIRVHGPEASIRAELRDYPDDAAMFADAVRLNASHGRRLDRQDQIRVTVLAQRFGLDTAAIGVLLHVEPATVVELRTRIVFEEEDDLPVPAKPVASHLFGQRLTREQVGAMKSFSGVRLGQQVTQLLRAVETGLFDRQDAGLCRRLHALARAITEHVPVPEEPAA